MRHAVIIGGGVAGSVAAAVLARAGHAPLLLERSSGAQHKVCGEFLSWEAADGLRAVGFDAHAIGGSRIGQVRLFAGRRSVIADLPRPAIGISRLVLDEALLAHASSCGARIERGSAVRAATACAGGFDLDVDGVTLRARELLLATGKTTLRGLARRIEGQQVTDDLVGFKAHYRLRPAQTRALAGAVELHLSGAGGYAGLQLVEGATANLCLLLPRGKLAAGSVAWEHALAELCTASPNLGERLAGAEMLFDRPLAISGVPYGFVHCAAADDPPGLIRLGDQFAVVHSFTGDGMAMAVISGVMAAGAEGGGRSYHAALARRVRRPVRLSAALHACLRLSPSGAAVVAILALCPPLLTAIARLTRVRA